MKTELEQLEENAKLQYTKERIGELVEHMNKSISDMREAMRWVMRTSLLNIFNIACYWAGVMIIEIKDLPVTYLQAHGNWFLLIFLLLVIREHHFEKLAEYAEGRLDGIYLAIKALYPSDYDKGVNNHKPIKQRSLFKRFKEFFERIKEGKTKEVPA